MSKNKTVVFDIETMNSISNLAKQYQMDILTKLSGIHPGPLDVFSVGSQTSKSTMTLKVLKNRYYGATDLTFWNDNLCKEIMLPMEPKSKYKFSRAKWHTARLDYSDALWRLGREYNEIIAWCNDTFGPHPKKPDAWSRWWVGIGEIYFRDEQDLVLYKLKWS